jgi:UDP-N-acetylmuramoylalanine--D-glutamate ligase
VPIIERALGEARGRQVVASQRRPVLHCVTSLEQAVSRAAEVAQAGEVVLLSPGGTSFDAFEDFEARGQMFCELVAAL